MIERRHFQFMELFFDFPSCRYVLFSVENVIMQVVYK